MSGLVAPFAGRAMDRWGARPVTVISLLLVAAGFLLRPLITSLWHWYLFSALVYAGFPGATVMPAGKLVGLWFPATRGRVMGAVTSGNNVGGLTMPALAQRRGGAARESRRLMESGITLRQALRTRRFWLILWGLFGATFTYQGVLTQLRQHFAEQGFTPALATTGLAVIAAMGIGSKLAFGRASERWTARLCCVVSVALQTVGLVIMALASSAPAMWSGIFVFGLGFGGLGALLVLIVQEAFGMKEFGAIFVVAIVCLLAAGGRGAMAGATNVLSANDSRG